MEAFYYTVEKVKNITGLTFSTLFIETCNAEYRLHPIMSEIFREENRINLTDTEGRSHSFPANNIVLFISNTSSAASLIIQSYIRLYGIPQISHASSSSWLNDKLRYPTFLRIVPSDEIQAKFIIQLASELKFERLGLISSSSSWGKSGVASIEQYAHIAGTCLSYVYQVDQIKKSVIALVDDLIDKINAYMRDGGCRVPKPMVIFAEQGILQTIFTQLLYRGVLWKRRGAFFHWSEKLG